MSKPKQKRTVRRKHKPGSKTQLPTTSPTAQAATQAEPHQQAELVPVPYDPYLLERSRTQWQFGDWPSLVALAEQELEHHPDRDKLAIMAAAGFAQQGDAAKAKQYTRLASGWGCDLKLIKQVMIAGVYNSLGRSSAAAGQGDRAADHFETAIATGMPRSDVHLLARARMDKQLELISLNDDATELINSRASWAMLQAPRISSSSHTPPRLRLVKEIDLGEAWAGNTINTVIFRHHGIMTVGEYQYTAFYVDEHTMRLVRRTLSDDTLQTYDLAGEYNLKDAHNSISLGMDREGHLHISYDHHATQLKYRRSQQPHNIQGWTEELSMTGNNEERVTYPTFILPRQGFPLTLLYRHGSHNNGTAYMKTYDEASQQWQDHPKPILSGANQKPWTANAYWNDPVVGNDGSLHLSFVWRTHTLGEEKRVNNINVGYAKSYDNGITWFTSTHQPYQLPITPTNAETVWPVSPGSNLINQCSMALDSQNRPHIVFYSNNPQGVPTYQHLWHNGISWQHQYLASASQPFNLQGGGTLQIPISRPVILIDKVDNIRVIYRDNGHGSSFNLLTLEAPDYRYHSDLIQMLAGDVGFSEPVIDRKRWAQSQVLSLFQQYSEQPDHDESIKPIGSVCSSLKVNDYN